jgi:hypothetical protein
MKFLFILLVLFISNSSMIINGRTTFMQYRFTIKGDSNVGI